MSWGGVENVEVVNDQLRSAVPRSEFRLDVTNEGDGCAVLDIVVSAEALHVVNRQRLHCAVRFEDACIEVVTVQLRLDRLCKGCFGRGELSVLVRFEVRRRLDRVFPRT